MFPDYQNMTMARLIDLLSERMQELSNMRLNNAGPKFDSLKEEVKQLQAAIESKKVISIYRGRKGDAPEQER